MNSILKNITPFENRRSVVAYSQNVGDIISGMLSTHDRYKNDYDQICMQFNGRTLHSIGKKLYDYLLKNTHYIVEPDSYQTLRSPAAILELGSKKNVGLDCKSYSLFIGGILDALQRKTGRYINWCYRFASYKPFSKLPHHVFVVINPDSNNEIWVDCCIDKFNYHKPYSYKTDRKAMLYSISGVGRTRKTKEQKKARAKKIKEKIKDKIKKGAKVVVKFNPATATARNAFLLLVKLNALKLATRLNLLIQKDPKKLQNFWKKIGGNYSSLLNNIRIGIKSKKSISGVGVASIAATIAAATPIILKVIDELKKAGINTDQLMKVGKDVLSKIANNKINDFANKQAEKEDSQSTESESTESESTETESTDSEPTDSENMDSEVSGICGFIPNKRRVKSINQLFK
jgi:hypothetical protein